MRWGVTCPVWRVSCPISSGPCSGGRGKGSKREEVDSAHPWTDTDDRNRHLVLDPCRRRSRRRKGWWTEHLTCLSLEFPICQRDTCQSIDLLGGPTNGWTYLKECWYTPRLIELTPLNSSPSSSWNERGERERKRLDALHPKSHHQYWIIPVQDFDVRSDIIMCGLTGGWNYITSLPLLQSTNQKNFEWNKGRQANDARQLCLYFNLLLLLLLPSFFFSFLIANLSYIFVSLLVVVVIFCAVLLLLLFGVVSILLFMLFAFKREGGRKRWWRAWKNGDTTKTCEESLQLITRYYNTRLHDGVHVTTKERKKKELIGIEIINELAGCFSILSPLPYVSRREAWNPFLSLSLSTTTTTTTTNNNNNNKVAWRWHHFPVVVYSSTQLNGRDEMEKKGQEISTVVAVVCGQPGSVFVRVLLTPSTVLPASHCPQQLHHSPSKTEKQEQVRRTADLFKSAARQ